MYTKYSRLHDDVNAIITRCVLGVMRIYNSVFTIAIGISVQVSEQIDRVLPPLGSKLSPLEDYTLLQLTKGDCLIGALRTSTNLLWGSADYGSY